MQILKILINAGLFDAKESYCFQVTKEKVKIGNVGRGFFIACIRNSMNGSYFAGIYGHSVYTNILETMPSSVIITSSSANTLLFESTNAGGLIVYTFGNATFVDRDVS